MAIHRANTERIREAIHHRETFDIASMRGRERCGDPYRSGIEFGQLPHEYRSSVERATYVVYSYRTPIAWFVDDEWVVPDVRYSNTTSNHQGIARVGISHGRLS
jgi:hypothetical protein